MGTHRVSLSLSRSHTRSFYPNVENNRKGMASNYHRVESPADLQAQLSADLNRVSVLYFRADWAEPCKTMDAVPYFILLRGHALLPRLSGVQPAVLSAAL